MKVYYTCPHCDFEFEVNVRINEEDDLPDYCPECNCEIPASAHEDVHIAAVEKASEPLDDDV